MLYSIVLNGREGKCTPQMLDAEVGYKFDQIRHSGEKGYDIAGTLTIEDYVIAIDASAHLGRSTYRKLECEVLGRNALASMDTRYEGTTGADLGAILAACVDEVIKEEVTRNHIPYKVDEAVYMEWKIEGGVATWSDDGSHWG